MHTVNRLYGLIGYPLGHSWSKDYFERKFSDEHIHDAAYALFPLKNISEIPEVIESNTDLAGFNVTVPHKIDIIPFLHRLHPLAQQTGAVNTVKIDRSRDKFTLHGYNTDVFGFETSVKPLLKHHHTHAIILGTGGAARAAAWVLNKLFINCVCISRNPQMKSQLAYSDIDKDLLTQYKLIVNATRLGMFPDVDSIPPLPYQYLTPDHLLFDMVYNPEETRFLAGGRKYGATVKNGLEMLQLQAEKAWEIWNGECEPSG